MLDVANLKQEVEAFDRTFGSSTNIVESQKEASPTVTIKNFESKDPFTPLKRIERGVTDTVAVDSPDQALLDNEELELCREKEKFQETEDVSLVNGCILCLQDDDTVRCLLTIGGVERESMLPRELFVEATIEIFQGAPFSATVVSENGFKSLKLLSRKPTINPRSKKEVYDLLEQL